MKLAHETLEGAVTNPHFPTVGNSKMTGFKLQAGVVPLPLIIDFDVDFKMKMAN